MKSLTGRPSVHQLTEYAVGFALASAAVRSDDRVLLAVCAFVVIVNAAVMEGPVAAFRWLPQGPHRVLDLVLAITGIVLAVAGGTSIATRAWLGGAALVIGFMSVRFTHVVRETRS